MFSLFGALPALANQEATFEGSDEGAVAILGTRSDDFGDAATSGTTYLLPVGWQLKLAQTFGKMSRVQFGGAYWHDENWGAGLDLGFDMGQREYVVTQGGVNRRVERLRYDVVPEVVLMRTLFTATTKRLHITAAGGPLLRKAEGRPLDVGYVLRAGPGVDWPLSKQLSFHFEQWVSWVSDPDAQVGSSVGFQPQLSLIWWFE